MKPLRAAVVVLVMATMVLPDSARADDPICDVDPGPPPAFVLLPPTCGGAETGEEGDEMLLVNADLYTDALDPQPAGSELPPDVPVQETQNTGACTPKDTVFYGEYESGDDGYGERRIFHNYGTLDCSSNVDTSKLVLKIQRKRSDGSWETMEARTVGPDTRDFHYGNTSWTCTTTQLRTYRGKVIGHWWFENGTKKTKGAVWPKLWKLRCSTPPES
ncbi:MAG TPA: hypothetical protein VGB83_01410 [Actinomycetota bacterium]